MSKIAQLSCVACIGAIAASLASPGYAQEAVSFSEDELSTDEGNSAIVVTGLRGRARSVTDSPVPVDVFSAEVIERSAQTDTLNVLQTLVPSFEVGRSNNSTSNSFIRAPSLRGLSADKTLLLLNGRRRHKSGSVTTGGSGAHVADAAVIPSIAVKSIEVLRDGAAAQYGSDAIAGVINFQLKDASDGGSLTAQVGQYYEGDGTSVQVAGNIGLPLTESGFINISAQVNDDDRTIRAGPFVSAAWTASTAYQNDPVFRAAVDAAGLDLTKPLEKSGKPIERAARFMVNSGIDLTDDTSVYAFGNYSRSKGTSNATYRVPGGGHNVLDNPIRLSDGSEWRFKDIFPLGLSPDFSGDVTDWSVAGGWKTERDLGSGHVLKADIGARWGYSAISYSMRDTVNPSMGPDSPTFFKASTYSTDEMALNADFEYTIPVDFLAGPLVFNFGAEYRREGYKIIAGEHDSYAGGTWLYPDPFGFCTDESDYSLRTLEPGAPTDKGINCTSINDPVYNTLQPGSNGITGISPDIASEYITDSHSLYAEITADVLEGWFVDFAARYENYQSFGDKIVWKVASRYAFTDWLAIRGSIGTGFRAPTAGQINVTQTQINTVDGVPLNSGLYPSIHPVAVYLGAEPLGPERSKNYSLGFTLTPANGLSLTVDAYRVKIFDQIRATTQIDVTPAIEAAMIAAGVVGASSIDRVNFFQNAFDSTVEGFDVVASYRMDGFLSEPTNITAAFNWNKYKIDRVNISSVSFDNVSRYNFTNNSPRWRGNVAVTQEFSPFTAMVRANLFGPYSRQATTAGNPIQSYDPQVVIDVELSAPLGDGYTFTLGVRNLLDHYPAKNELNPTNGRLYTDGPVDWQGGYYYGRLSYSF